MSVILALGSLRHEDLKFKDSLGCMSPKKAKTAGDVTQQQSTCLQVPGPGLDTQHLKKNVQKSILR
jgi:hypothetical protein